MASNEQRYGDVPENYHRKDRTEMFRYLPDGARTFLEVGCGEGGFGELIKRERDAEVWGIELIAHVAEKAKERLDRVIIGNIETDQFDLPVGYFDCIIFNDVLEHLYDPWNVLYRFKMLLVQGGFVVASIPNIRYYVQMKKLILGGEWEYASYGVMDRTHLRFFTKKSIVSLFSRTGYELQQLEGINSEQLPFKLNMLNRLLFNRLEDMRHLQFACVARSI